MPESDSGNDYQTEYCDDDSPPTSNVEDELMWRSDPEETFSDWRIEIAVIKQLDESSKEDNVEETSESKKRDHILEEDSTTYHVHKCVLAGGLRKSGYFTTLFRAANAGMYNESDANTSRIALEPLAAAAFPAFLDYMYAPHRPLEISTNTATALQFLGEYFDNPTLRWDARQFCIKDMSIENVDVYYKHAMAFQNERLLSIVAGFTGNNLESIEPSSSIVKHAEPAFWVQVLGAARADLNSNDSENEPKFSRHWSRLIAEIATKKIGTLDKAIFDELTNVSVMPYIYSKAALVLCEVEDRFASLEEGDDSEEQEGGDYGLRPFQRRCSVSIAKAWKKISNDEATMQKLGSREPAFLVSLLAEVSKEAKSDLKDLREEAQRNEQRLKVSLSKFEPVPGQYQKYSSMNGSSLSLELQLRYPGHSNLTAVPSFKHFSGKNFPLFYHCNN